MKAFVEKITRPSRKWTDQFIIAAILSVVLLVAGSVVSDIIYKATDAPSLFEKWLGSDNLAAFFSEYLMFIGIWIITFLFVVVPKSNRPMLKAWGYNRDGNNIKGIIAGALLGFGCNGFCVLMSVLMGGLIIQGLQPGPELFTKYAEMTYTFFAGFVVTQFFMLMIGLGGCRLFAHISRLSDAILIPCVFVLCVVGSFAINNSFVEVGIMFLFGFFGYLMRKLDLNTAAVVLALILGPIGERGLRRSLTLSGNDISILFSTPICWILIAMCILSSFSPLLMKVLKKREKAGEAK